MKLTTAGLCCLFALLAAGSAMAAGPTGEPAVGAAGAVKLAADPALAVENPLARVVNLQLNGNVNFDKGAAERTQAVGLFGATIPVDLPRRWNLFLNASLPVMDQPVGVADRVQGLGDTTLNLFFSPPSSPHWVFAAGSSIVLPTATDATLGQGKWDAGPAMALVHTERTWVAGAAVSQSWSITGANDRLGVSRLLISPFVTWRLDKSWYLFTAPTLSADWNTTTNRAWTVPLGGGVGHVIRRGKHAVNFAVQAYANVVRPNGAPSWQLRLTTGWVFPK